MTEGPVVVTGVAGFIGAAVAGALLDQGRAVLGIDILNDYYDPALKRARLARLAGRQGFSFHPVDITDAAGLAEILRPPVAGTIHLAAQAGVRYSIENPLAYIDANLTGTMTLLEALRRAEVGGPFVYASSSSVYGAGATVPFAIGHRTDEPVSIYGATKKATEVLLHAYAHLHRVRATGLRFFTVYGPWGRPDMAPHIFTRAVLTGRPVRLYGAGLLSRDFTYIDDIARGVIAAFDRPPTDDGATPPHRIFNLGNTRAEVVRDFLAAIEEACGRVAIIEEAPMQPGDVPRTWADIAESRAELDFAPTTTIAEGVPRFVSWFRHHYGL